MTIDEGYIKYQSDWTPGPAPSVSCAQQLEASRKILFAAGLIGHYDELNVGFGNISIRYGAPGQFLITGTQTGHIETTSEAHYSLVTQYDVDRNTVSCTGPAQASSEAMTHAAIYELHPGIVAVVHVHSKLLWDRHLNQLPTTSADIPYGTPQMAQEFRRLYEETAFSSQGLAVMGGHEEGLVSIGESLDVATSRVMALLD
tara:strand:- start:16120 stop:16722 length:603 start_codon:yes stop_codon:yes gene_type:complete